MNKKYLQYFRQNRWFVCHHFVITTGGENCWGMNVNGKRVVRGAPMRQPEEATSHRIR